MKEHRTIVKEAQSAVTATRAAAPAARKGPAALSAIVTARNDERWLERLLVDLTQQEESCPPFEVVIVEAGSFELPPPLEASMRSRFAFQFIRIPGIPRSKALNLAFERAASPFVVRLDARTHIGPEYLRLLYELRKRTGAENVGGVKVPMGLHTSQRIIAEVMKQPFCFGGAAFRRESYRGLADTVYLGAYDREAVRRVGGFDEEWLLISEDADLNARLRDAGHRVYVDSSIKAYYFARETPREFVKLCRSYGVSRVLFLRKHRRITGIRQLAVPLFFASFVLFGAAAVATGFLPFVIAAAAESLCYGVLLLGSSVLVARSVREKPIRAFAMAMRLFVIAHTYWLEGMIKGLALQKERQ